PDGLAMSPRGWAYLAAYLLDVLRWVTMATALAVLTRSVAVSVAAPITWMLLIEQLASMVTMLEAITPSLPFNASHKLLAQAPVQDPRARPACSRPVASLVPSLTLPGDRLCDDGRRYSALRAGLRLASTDQDGSSRRRAGADSHRRSTNGRLCEQRSGGDDREHFA